MKCHASRLRGAHRCAALPVGVAVLWVVLTMPAQGQEFFPADSFLRGFTVSPPMISRQIPLAEFGHLTAMDPEAEAPFWTLSQWFCVESLSDEHRTLSGRDRSVWENDYQGLEVRVDEDGHPVVSLTVDSLAVYREMSLTYEQMGRRRPHVLLGHNFYPDFDGVRRYGGAEDKDTTPDGTTFPDLDAFEELTLSMSLRLAEATDLRHEYAVDDAENRRRHYNRNCFQFWFRVYCRDPHSPYHGRFFWLGYRAYDGEVPYQSHIPHVRDQIESDGNATYAYRLCDRSVHGDDYAAKLAAFHAGTRTTLTIDVLEAARTAIGAIQAEKDDFLDAEDDLGGYTISSFNIGWEPASPFRGTMVIRDLSLRGVPLGDVSPDSQQAG
ncbi:MAG: hypothetical protein GF320_06750 [Armatimonadia bacterium]|nr:hypothetical protein [Armatimonadia bacterium]